MTKIFVTGSQGLIGKKLCKALVSLHIEVQELDIALPEHEKSFGSTLDLPNLKTLMKDCDGIVHLAAVSRVIWAQQAPDRCIAINQVGTANVLEAAKESHKKPWILFASSREVYGQQLQFPVKEAAQFKPLNVYARSKVFGENLVEKFRVAGFQTAIVRYSSVYGTTDDHHDRVIPAFCRAATMGSTLRIDGANNTFDFTHVDDTIAGTLKIIEQLISGEKNLPPIHLTTGKGTTLLETAQLASHFANKECKITEAPPRSFDVAHFIGTSLRAQSLLGWKAKIDIQQGIKQLVLDFKKEQEEISYENS